MRVSMAGDLNENIKRRKEATDAVRAKSLQRLRNDSKYKRGGADPIIMLASDLIAKAKANNVQWQYWSLN